ncbi:hypothetical protein MDAP_002038 [Mitosporidium daphniae]
MNRTGFIRYAQQHLLNSMKYYLSMRDYGSLLLVLEKSLYLFVVYPEELSKIMFSIIDSIPLYNNQVKIFLLQLFVTDKPRRVVYLAECLRYLSRFQMYQEAYDLLTSHLVQKPYLEMQIFHGFAGFFALRIWERLSAENTDGHPKANNSGILSSLFVFQSHGPAKYRKRAVDHYSAYLRIVNKKAKESPLMKFFRSSPFVEYENVFLYDCDLLNLIHSSANENCAGSP